MVRRAKFADGTPKPLPKPERSFQDKIKRLKKVAPGLSPNSVVQLFKLMLDEAVEKGQITEEYRTQQLMPLFGETGEKVTERIEAYERDNFSKGTSLMDEYLGAQKEYQKAVDNGFQGTYEEFFRNYFSIFNCLIS